MTGSFLSPEKQLRIKFISSGIAFIAKTTSAITPAKMSISKITLIIGYRLKKRKIKYTGKDNMAPRSTGMRVKMVIIIGNQMKYRNGKDEIRPYAKKTGMIKLKFFFTSYI